MMRSLPFHSQWRLGTLDRHSRGRSEERSVMATVFRIRLVGAAAALLSTLSVGVAQQNSRETTQAARPMRTEAEARARAETSRREREQLRLKAGAPAELISDYVKANIE